MKMLLKMIQSHTLSAIIFLSLPDAIATAVPALDHYLLLITAKLTGPDAAGSPVHKQSDFLPQVHLRIYPDVISSALISR
jgi:hypothetical protein